MYVYGPVAITQLLISCKSSLFENTKGGQQTNEDIVTKLERLERTNEDILTALKHLKLKQADTKITPQISPAQQGDKVIQQAKDHGTYSTFQGEVGAEAALSPETLNAIDGCKTEHQLVAMLTSPLEDIFGDSLVLVNSEEYPWLVTSKDKKYNQKPDLFLCPEEIYTKKQPWVANVTLHERQESHKFGALSDWALRDCLVATFEAKLKIDNKAVGEAANYGYHIVSGDNAPPLARIVLFDKKTFFLMIVTSVIHPVTIIECQWCTPGSKALLRSVSLDPKPWTASIKTVLLKWNLKIARDDKGSAWLGRGRYGRVFRVSKDGSDKQMALKVVLESNSLMLSMEKAMLRMAAEECSDFVMPIEEDPKNLDWALLMLHAGSPVTKKQYAGVIQLLAALHEKGFLHGDPRLTNVVSVGGTLYWIDFMSGRDIVTPAAKLKDMKNLEANIIHPIGIHECKSLDKYDGSTVTVGDLISDVNQIMSQYQSETDN
jgi:hypothetical protein